MQPQRQRDQMITRDLRGRGIQDGRVLAAMSRVPREAFVPEALAGAAYDDRPLPIEAGQTISQPYIVAWMAEVARLEPADRVLEIGTGSGYAAAVLALLVRQVDTIERVPELAASARARLADLGMTNVQVRCSDGTLGWPVRAPYDAILVAAGGPEVPRALLAQLTLGGRLVMPIGTHAAQRLVRVTRTGEHAYVREDLGGVLFVPLIGAEGWAEPGRPDGGDEPSP